MTDGKSEGWCQYGEECVSEGDGGPDRTVHERWGPPRPRETNESDVTASFDNGKSVALGERMARRRSAWSNQVEIGFPSVGIHSNLLLHFSYDVCYSVLQVNLASLLEAFQSNRFFSRGHDPVTQVRSARILTDVGDFP